MCKKNFTISLINKAQCAEILLKYHYLKDISKGFKSGVNFGLFKSNELVGVAIFTGFPVPELVVGMFGLPRNEQKGFYELSRLCLAPHVQTEEHNLASWFLAKCIKKLKEQNKVRAILSYADANFHNGTVYRASNFSYYGLSFPKKDFWVKQKDGSYTKHSRGSIKGLTGEWRERSQKHRFVLLYDKTLNMKWPLISSKIEFPTNAALKEGE